MDTEREGAGPSIVVQDTEDGVSLLPKSNSKSAVWQYFGLKADETGKPISDGTATCKVCKRTVTAKNGNTSNLRSHLKNNHKVLFTQMEQTQQSQSSILPRKRKEKDQPGIAECMVKSQPYSHHGTRWKELNRAVGFFICKDRQPINIVEREGFRKLVRTLDCRYEMPSRTHFSNSIIPELYTTTKASLRQRLRKVSYFAGTTDLWSSVGLTPYLGYTIHFINEDWKLESIALSCSFMPEDHTAVNIADAMVETLTEWNLSSDKQVCLTSDSAANVVAAARSLEWNRLSCFGHNLHLAITKAIDSDSRCTRALAVARKIVSAFSTSWKRQRNLTQAQISLKIPQHSLIHDCATRWGSMQRMIERILEQESAIRVVLSSDRKASHLLLTWQDVEVLKAISSALSPLSEFTDVLSGEHYVTISAILPIMQLLTDSVLNEKEDDVPLSNELRASILADLLGRNTNDDIVHLFEVTSFLDPRFKSKFVCTDDLDLVKETVLRDGVTLHSTTTVGDSVNVSDTSVGSASSTKKRTLGSLLKSHVDNTADSAESLTCPISPHQFITSELDRYLVQPGLDEEEDPLMWWKAHEFDYPMLARVVKKYLCVPATSTPSERLFSKSGQVVSPQRASLNPETVQMLVFLSNNL